jgi:hypothetical protein
MKKFFLPVALAAVLVPGASAQSVFDGTWKLDFNRVNFQEKHDEFLLQDGVYTCKTCPDSTPLRTDGSDQPYSGFPNADTVAVNIVNDFQIELIGKKAGTVVGTTTMTVTPDGTMLASQSSYNSQTEDDLPIRETKVWTRLSSGPSGSHRVSGAWRGKKMGVSDNGAALTYKTNGNELTVTGPFGRGFTARMDGTEAPYNGDPTMTSVRVRLISGNTLEETDINAGKILRVTRMTVGPDGKTARIVTEDKRLNSTSTAEALKE